MFISARHHKLRIQAEDDKRGIDNNGKIGRETGSAAQLNHLTGSKFQNISEIYIQEKLVYEFHWLSTSLAYFIP